MFQKLFLDLISKSQSGEVTLLIYTRQVSANFNILGIIGGLEKHKLKPTCSFAFESARMRIVLKFLDHLLPQSYCPHVFTNILK